MALRPSRFWPGQKISAAQEIIFYFLIGVRLLLASFLYSRTGPGDYLSPYWRTLRVGVPRLFASERTAKTSIGNRRSGADSPSPAPSCSNTPMCKVGASVVVTLLEQKSIIRRQLLKESGIRKFVLDPWDKLLKKSGNRDLVLDPPVDVTENNTCNPRICPIDVH